MTASAYVVDASTAGQGQWRDRSSGRASGLLSLARSDLHGSHGRGDAVVDNAVRLKLGVVRLRAMAWHLWRADGAVGVDAQRVVVHLAPHRIDRVTIKLE